MMRKTMTFACVHFSVAFSVTFALTGRVMLGGAIAIVEPAVNTVAYYYQEKSEIKFGGKHFVIA